MDLNIKIPEGFDLIGNYNNQYVIAKNQSPSAPEPYVVWAVDYDKKGVHSGTYFASLQMAQLSFCERAFDAEQLYAAHAKLDRMQELTHQSAVEAAEHLYYAVTADDIKAAIKAVYNLESQRAIVQIEKILQQHGIPYELCGEYYGKEFCARPEDQTEKLKKESKPTPDSTYHDEKLLEEIYRRIVCATPEKERRHILNIIHKSIYTEKRCPYAGAAFKALEKADDLARYAKRFNVSLDELF